MPSADGLGGVRSATSMARAATPAAAFFADGGVSAWGVAGRFFSSVVSDRIVLLLLHALP